MLVVLRLGRGKKLTDTFCFRFLTLLYGKFPKRTDFFCSSVKSLLSFIKMRNNFTKSIYSNPWGTVSDIFFSCLKTFNYSSDFHLPQFVFSYYRYGLKYSNYDWFYCTFIFYNFLKTPWQSPGIHLVLRSPSFLLCDLQEWQRLVADELFTSCWLKLNLVFCMK